MFAFKSRVWELQQGVIAHFVSGVDWEQRTTERGRHEKRCCRERGVKVRSYRVPTHCSSKYVKPFQTLFPVFFSLKI